MNEFPEFLMVLVKQPEKKVIYFDRIDELQHLKNTHEPLGWDPIALYHKEAQLSDLFLREHNKKKEISQ